jgi:selenocysteine lyase/cysteine desulfurase
MSLQRRGQVFYLYNTPDEIDALVEALNEAVKFFGR